MPLALLEDVRGLLLVPASDLSRDAGLQLVLSAVEAAILDETGYSLATETRTDYLRNVMTGVATQLPRRPLDPSVAPVVNGRLIGPTPLSWTLLVGDVPDPTTGLIVILGANEVPVYDYSSTFPPQATPSRFFRWRSFRWPVVRVTYKVTGISEDIPADLTGAVVQLTAAYAAKIMGSGGNLQSVTALGVAESYFQPSSAMPPGVNGMLSRHRLNKGVRVIV